MSDGFVEPTARPPLEIPGMHAEDLDHFERMLRSLTEQDFRTQLRDFTQGHCQVFANADAESATGEGHSHACHQLHQQYKALFDSRIESFLQSEGIDSKDFIFLAEMMTKALPEARRGWNGFLAEITGSEDYGRFARLMTAAAARQRAEPAGAAMAGSLDPADVAAAEAAASAQPASSYHYQAADGQTYGPAAVEDLMAVWGSGQLHLDSLVWFPGLSGWLQLSQLPDLVSLLGPPGPR